MHQICRGTALIAEAGAYLQRHLDLAPLGRLTVLVENRLDVEREEVPAASYYFKAIFGMRWKS